MYKLMVIFLIQFLFCESSSCQSKDSSDKYIPQKLEGYFILVRDSLPKTDIDVSLAHLSFNTFFIKSINENTLDCLLKLGRPKYDSVVFISGGTNYSIADAREHNKYIHWLIDNKYFEKADKGFPLFDESKIPNLLVNSNHRFISIYKGQCKVVGPFFPYNKLQLKNHALYMYLPLDSNQTEYLYSIIY